jgi:hypothetical protein
VHVARSSCLIVSAYVGGLRDRLIHDSVYYVLRNGLEMLGWFPGGVNAPQVNPVKLVPEQQDWSQEIELNTISVAPYSTTDTEWELGSDLRANRWTFYVDVFGANEAIGLQLSGDVRDILRGKFSALSGSITPEAIQIMDYTMATPVKIFTVDVDSVTRDRAVQTSHRWSNYMFSITCQLCDYYDTDQDSEYLGYSP